MVGSPFHVAAGVPFLVAISSDDCTVQLEIDGARSPREVQGTMDARTLGIALNRIGFRF